MSVTMRLADDLDISRGDMICRSRNQPSASQDIEAMVCWMDERSPLRPGAKYSIKHTSRWARAVVKEVQYRLDVNTLHRDVQVAGAAPQRNGPGACCAPRRRC